MGLKKEQSSMILKLLCFKLSEERDMVKITTIIKEFEETFGSDIPDWKADLAALLKNELSGYNAMAILKNWK